jgi:hypothetical protein
LSLLLVPCPQRLATLSYLRSALFELLELYDPRLVGVHEPRLLPREAPQVSLELLRRSLLSATVFRGRAGEILELGKQPLGISHQVLYVLPDRFLQFTCLGRTLSALVFTGAQDGVLAVALVVTMLGSGVGGLVGHPEHRQPTALAAEEAAQEIGVLLVVAEGESGVALQLGLGESAGLFVYDRWDGDGDPFLFGPEPSRGVLPACGSPSPGLLGRHVAVAVGVGRAGIDRIGEDVVHYRSRPPSATGAGEPGSGIQTLEDLADGHPLLDEPSVEHPNQLGFRLIDDKMAAHAVPLGDVAVAVGRPTADEVSIACLLELAAPEAFPEQRPLVLGDRTPYLEQELVVWVIRDGAIDEDDLTACAPQLFEQ